MSEEIDVLSVSIDEKQIGVETFRVYPNPNEGYFTIEIETLKGGDATLDIVNVLGHVVYSEQMKDIKGKRIIQTDLSKNSKGVYFINLYYNNEVINRRIVVQ
jgi:hypothetical protein